MKRPFFVATPSGQIVPGLLLAVVTAFCTTPLSLVFTIAPTHQSRIASGERQEAPEPSSAKPSPAQTGSPLANARHMPFDISEHGWTLVGAIESTDSDSDDGMAKESWQPVCSLPPGGDLVAGLTQNDEARAWEMAPGAYPSGAAPPCQREKFSQSILRA